jgi:hypothetical protein
VQVAVVNAARLAVTERPGFCTGPVKSLSFSRTRRRKFFFLIFVWARHSSISRHRRRLFGLHPVCSALAAVYNSDSAADYRALTAFRCWLCRLHINAAT